MALLWLAALWLGWFPERPNAGLLKAVVLILYMHAGVLSLKHGVCRAGGGTK